VIARENRGVWKDEDDNYRPKCRFDMHSEDLQKGVSTSIRSADVQEHAKLNCDLSREGDVSTIVEELSCAKLNKQFRRRRENPLSSTGSSWPSRRENYTR
jgi:hypothetical protein